MNQISNAETTQREKYGPRHPHFVINMRGGWVRLRLFYNDLNYNWSLLFTFFYLQYTICNSILRKYEIKLSRGYAAYQSQPMRPRSM
jgi:hypothetical protein